MAKGRKPKGGNADTREALILATEELIRDEGYGAVTSRRIADKAGVQSPLIHYYFDSMDDLYVAVWRRLKDSWLEQMFPASPTEAPVYSLWKHAGGPQAKLIMEFIALANHVPLVRGELAHFVTRARKRQIDDLAKYYKARGIEPAIPVGAIPLILRSISHLLAQETALGVSVGHRDTEIAVKYLLKRLAEDGLGGGQGAEPQGAEDSPPAAKQPAHPPRRRKTSKG